VLQTSFFSPSTTATARGLPFVLPFQKDGPNKLHLVSHWIHTANALSIWREEVDLSWRRCSHQKTLRSIWGLHGSNHIKGAWSEWSEVLSEL
jgi:hypothetical protein